MSVDCADDAFVAEFTDRLNFKVSATARGAIKVDADANAQLARLSATPIKTSSQQTPALILY